MNGMWVACVAQPTCCTPALSTCHTSALRPRPQARYTQEHDCYQVGGVGPSRLLQGHRGGDKDVRRYLGFKTRTTCAVLCCGDRSWPLQDYSAPALSAFRGWLRSRRPRIEDLNMRWGTTFASWEELTPPVLEAGSFPGVDMSPRWVWRGAGGGGSTYRRTRRASIYTIFYTCAHTHTHIAPSGRASFCYFLFNTHTHTHTYPATL